MPSSTCAPLAGLLLEDRADLGVVVGDCRGVTSPSSRPASVEGRLGGRLLLVRPARALRPVRRSARWARSSLPSRASAAIAPPRSRTASDRDDGDDPALAAPGLLVLVVPVVLAVVEP